ncbi:DUF6597 domain-containing transcriptional factor [Streptomyces sp. NPDC092296]|uniref:DUF6597 domain-containing transcriptional factor n=1 Tax=Streptomyces sp. NPDC092296 TaxID=3366012 RepID=UPI0037FEADF0
MTFSRYAQWRPAALPARYAVCLWSRETVGLRPHGQLIVPDGCVDLIWRGGALELVGPDLGPRTVEVPGGAGVVGVRLRPGAAGLLLGPVPASEVRDAQLPLEEFHGDRARRLAERLAGADGPQAAARELDRFTAELLRGHRPDPVVERAVAALGRPAPSRLPQLAAALTLSGRQLRRRVTDAVGYGPKQLHAVLRFQRALILARTTGAPASASTRSAAGTAIGWPVGPRTSGSRPKA